MRKNKYHSVNLGTHRVNMHTLIVEKILGHALPLKAEIHHFDGNGKNNKNDNLIVCPSAAYHKLLHRRTEALDKCGHANWLKCVFCKKFDAPENLHLYMPKDQTSPRANHGECQVRYDSQRRKEALVENSFS